MAKKSMAQLYTAMLQFSTKKKKKKEKARGILTVFIIANLYIVKIPIIKKAIKIIIAKIFIFFPFNILVSPIFCIYNVKSNKFLIMEKQH